MPTAKVVAERTFFPYRPFLDSARHFCQEMERKDYVSWYDLLAATTLLALAVEALVNTVGELLIEDFTDFESGSSKAKVRLICDVAGISYQKNDAPFNEVLALLRLRNKLAHPKFKRLRYESAAMPLEQAQRHYREYGLPLHDIEKELSPERTQKALMAVSALERLFLSAVDDDQRREVSVSRLVISDDAEA